MDHVVYFMIGRAVHKPRPARQIHPVLLERTRNEAGIGYIDMSVIPTSNTFATKGSGLLFGKDRRKAYVEADPRVRGVRRQSNTYQRMELDNGDGTTQVVYVDKETGVQVDRPPQHLKKVNMQKNT